MPEITVSVNKNSLEALARIANKIDTFPNRIQKAQSTALYEVIDKLPSKLLKYGHAAVYLDYDVYTYGPVGLKLKIGPSKVDKKGKNGYSTKMATRVLLSGRRGGRVVHAKNKKFKLRPNSVNDGYPAYLSKYKLGAIRSKREDIKKEAKQLILDSLKKQYAKQGFGVRGGSTNISGDIGSR